MPTLAALALAVFLTVTGITHFLAPAYFRTLVPDWLAVPGAFVMASGLAEIITGCLLFVPATRAAGGWTASALITAYLVSHLDALRHARRSQRRFLDRPTGVAARLVVNVGYLGWAVVVALTAGR